MILCFLLVTSLFMGIAVAVNPIEASVSTVFSDSTPSPGQLVAITITFQSNTNQQLKIYYLGIHFDWMATDGFYGLDLSDNPVVVPAMSNYTAQSFTIIVPASASIGPHNYYIGVDGLDSSSNAFSWDSSTSNIEVVAPKSATAVFSDSTPIPGQTITVSLTFQNNIDEQLRIFYIGIHSDWMASDGFYGQDISGNPATVQGQSTYVAETFTITVPVNASVGSHSYYIGVDGLNATGEPFSWDSPASNIEVVAAPTPTPTPAQTASPTSNPTSTPISKPVPKLEKPTIDLTCKGTGTDSGFKLEINGTLLLNGNPITNSPVQIYYSLDGDKWEALAIANTLWDGSFGAVWCPDKAGSYLIKASSAATTNLEATSKVINVALTPDLENNVFTLNSNSTITQFAFNSTSNQLSFIASGDSGTIGHVEVYIPKSMFSEISQLKTYIDNKQVSFISESQGDWWLISFSYSHSQHIVTMLIDEGTQTSNADYTPILMYAIPIAVIAIVVIAALVMLKRKTKPSGI